MHISELAYKYRVFYWTLVAALVFGGVYAFIKIAKLEDPEIVVMQAMVVTIYPGASAEEVEEQVTNVLENEIRTIDNIALIKSTSAANTSQISVTLSFTVPEDEITQYWDVLRRKVNGAVSKLPSGCMAPMVMDDFSDVYGMFYAVRGEGFSKAELNKYANYIKKELLVVEGVKRIEVIGYQPPVVNIELVPEKLAQLGVYPVQVLMAVNSQLSPVYGGSYEQQGSSLRINVDGRVTSIDDIRNMTINGFEDDQMKLSDIANVSWGEAEPARFSMMYNGVEALGLAISMESDCNVIDVGERVEARLDELMGMIPVGVTMDKIFFQPDKVSEAIDGFMINLVESVLVVVLVLMFTMGFRSGVIIGIGLVLTVLATFPILYMLDGTLQRISLGAFIVAMGMLVDNAIVVQDGIIVDLQMKKGVRYALFNTAKKTAMPLLGATSIAVITFLPVYLSPDTAGVYVGDLFLVLCISLLLSWVFALTQVPIFSSFMLPIRKLSKAPTSPFDRPFYKKMEKLLHIMMDKKVTTVTVAAVLLGVALFGFKYVNMTFFPDFNYNQGIIEYTIPRKDVAVKDVLADMKDISDTLLQMEGIRAVTASHGMTPIRYCLVRPFNQTGDNYAEFIVEFDDFKTMKKMRSKIEDYLSEAYPDAMTRFRMYNLSIMASHTVEVEFTGPDMNVLRQLEEKAEDVMRRNPLVVQRSIQSAQDPPSKTLVAHYAEEAARAIGTSRTDISNTFLAATDGMPIGNLWKDDAAYPIYLKLRNADGSRITYLDNLPVWNMIPNIGAIDEKDVSDVVFGTQTTADLQKKVVSSVPMSQVVDGIDLAFEEAVIYHTNGHRAIEAQCDPVEWSSPSDARSYMLDEIENIELPEGYSMRWVGEYDLSKMALTNIINLLPLAAVLIVFVLVLLFNNIRKTLIVLLCLPLAAIGIVPGLLIFDQPFSFVAIVGTIGMAGMLIKNSIVLIDEIDVQMKSGVVAYDAVIKATVSRIRPVMMASLTTILGMIPLLPDPMYGALAVTVMCGLLVGTIITLVILPIIYALFFKIKQS